MKKQLNYQLRKTNEDLKKEIYNLDKLKRNACKQVKDILLSLLYKISSEIFKVYFSILHTKDFSKIQKELI